MVVGPRVFLSPLITTMHLLSLLLLQNRAGFGPVYVCLSNCGTQQVRWGWGRIGGGGEAGGPLGG